MEGLIFGFFFISSRNAKISVWTIGMNIGA